MKKVILALGVVALFGLSSCKKDYTCTCTMEVPGMDPQSITHDWENLKKSDAEDACEDLDNAGGETTTCELD